MSLLKSLLDKLSAAKNRIAELDEKIASLTDQQTKFESEPPDHTKIDVSDSQSLLAGAARKVALEVLPKQIQDLHQARWNMAPEIADIAENIKTEIARIAAEEQQKFADEIAGKLAPYSTMLEQNIGGKMEKLDPARSAAWGMPLVLGIGAATRLRAETPRRWMSGNSKDEQRIFLSESLKYADELASIAERYFENGNSFVPEIFKKKMS